MKSLQFVPKIWKLFVVAPADDGAVVDVVAFEPLAADGDIAHIAIEHRDGDRGLLDETAQVCIAREPLLGRHDVILRGSQQLDGEGEYGRGADERHHNGDVVYILHRHEKTVADGEAEGRGDRAADWSGQNRRENDGGMEGDVGRPALKLWKDRDAGDESDEDECDC